MCLYHWIRLGKTRVALMLASAFVKRNENCSILVVVPTEVLKNQWIDHLEEWNLLNNVRVEIVNSVIKLQWTCDLLILDEAHRFSSDTFCETFNCVDYKNILCLTGTLERLDGKEQIIKKYAPVCDTISFQEAIENKWVSPVKEYLVLIDVDLTEYNEQSKIFNQCFAYFDFNFNNAMQCSINKVYARTYAKKLGLDWNQVIGIAQKWGRSMRARKDFIQNHPKKFEVAKKIMAARSDRKGITFSATIKQAESLGGPYVIHSKKKKNENKKIIEAFNNVSSGFLNTSKAANEGIDVPGLSVGINLAVDSSKITSQQKRGRICRFQEGKEAELFIIVLKGTQEYHWAQNSATNDYITINEVQLDRILAGESIETREREIVTNTKFRY